jgi:hypothetical protein
MAATALICFIAGIAFREYWPKMVAWLDKPASKVSHKYPSQFPTPEIHSPLEAVPGDVRGESPKPIDKRRRGLAEMRHIAEQKSKIPLDHQAKVTANNIKAMES